MLPKVAKALARGQPVPKFYRMGLSIYNLALDRLVEHIRPRFSTLLHMFFSQCAPWLIVYYILTKWLYVFVAYLQLVIIVHFVGESDYLWGVKVIFGVFITIT